MYGPDEAQTGETSATGCVFRPPRESTTAFHLAVTLPLVGCRYLGVEDHLVAENYLGVEDYLVVGRLSGGRSSLGV